MARLRAEDLNYKKDPLRIEYDIESLGSLFTAIFMHDNALTLIFFSDDRYDFITDDDFLDVMKKFTSEKTHMDSLGIESPDDIDYRVYRYRVGNRRDMKEFEKFLLKFMNCKPSIDDIQYGKEFVEYCGWNSARYDLPLMLLIYMLLTEKGENTTPYDIRLLSNMIIGYDGPPWGFARHLEEETANSFKIEASDYKTFFNQAIYADGHIDWAKIARAADGGDELKFPPGLKKEMARFGMDIVIDEMVSSDGPETIHSAEEVLDLVYYNINDVLGTRLVGRNSIIQAGLYTRDIVRQMYPYTAAKSMDFDKVYRYTPSERDASAANLAGTVLIGPKRRKPEDWSEVRYEFPVPDGKGGTKIVDLFDHIRENEEFWHPYWEEFFNHFRGKDTAASYDNWRVIKAQPITHSSTMNVPYYRDGKPLDTYITVSTGGAHGSVMAGLSKKSPEEIESWIKADVGAIDSEKPTVDLDDVIHLDWSSFYPVMASKMGLYATSELDEKGNPVDRYTGIIEYRIRIKETIPFDKSEWTDEHREMQEEQMGLKFVLNNATGAGNTHSKYALLPVDNKTLSMRLIGNMLIWTLAQRLSQAGGFVISTNTDGIYMTGLPIEEVEKIVEKYVEVYGMEVEPEVMSRFINRDTSNRIEIVNGHLQNVNGRLRHGIRTQYTDDSIGRNVPYPLAVARAAIDYMVEDRDWLTKPYDRERLQSLIKRLYDESDSPEAWYQIHVGSGSTRLTLDGVQQARINRVVMTKDGVGGHIGSERAMKPKKAEVLEIWNAVKNGAKTLDEITDVTDLIWHESIVGADPTTMIWATERIIDERTKEKEIISVPMAIPSEELDEARFNELWKESGAKNLAVRIGDEYVMIKKWSPGALSGYTSDNGAILNTAQSLIDFDMENLDLNAYLRWSEQLLAGWKITADIPEIGLTDQDDTVVPGQGGSKRITKKERAAMMIERLYAVG